MKYVNVLYINESVYKNGMPSSPLREGLGGVFELKGERLKGGRCLISGNGM